MRAVRAETFESSWHDTWHAEMNLLFGAVPADMYANVLLAVPVDLDALVCCRKDGNKPFCAGPVAAVELDAKVIDDKGERNLVNAMMEKARDKRVFKIPCRGENVVD
jgi:CDGSH-type Zn-finger protein